MLNDKDLLDRISCWDGISHGERDNLRAMLYCRREGLDFDSIVGEGDNRHILYTDDIAVGGMGPEGGSAEFAEIDIWPAAPKHDAPRDLSALEYIAIACAIAIVVSVAVFYFGGA